MVSIRAYDDRDHDAVMALADRLTVGAATFRDRDRWLAVVRGWVAESVAAVDSAGHALLVAEDEGDVVGFAGLSTRTHFTGDLDAYLGELVVAATHEGRGVGRRLLQAAESWARHNGFATLALDTGAANTRARELYAASGFVEEDIRLTKRLA